VALQSRPRTHARWVTWLNSKNPDAPAEDWRWLTEKDRSLASRQGIASASPMSRASSAASCSCRPLRDWNARPQNRHGGNKGSGGKCLARTDIKLPARPWDALPRRRLGVRPNRIGVGVYHKVTSEACVWNRRLHECFTHSVRMDLAAVRTWDLDLGMPWLCERPHVSCYFRPDRAVSGWAKHGQMICVALGFLSRSLHIGLPLI